MNADELIKLLPNNYEKTCYETKAITRNRTINNPKDLMKLLLYYLYEASLVSVSQYALINNIGKISDVALMKRFNKCKDWIKSVIENIKPNEIINYNKPVELEQYNVFAADASVISEKSAVHKEWHLHYMVNLFSLNCSQFKITEQTIGETLKNFEYHENDLVIADRIYGTVSGMEYCLDQGGDFIIRLRNKAFNIYNEAKEKIILLDWLKSIDDKAAEIKVYFKDSQKQYRPIRICAIHKSEDEIRIEEQRIEKRAAKKQREISEETKFTHCFIIVATSLPKTISAAKILDFYRLRWQVEIVFKRYKSVLGMGNMPTKTKEASEVWLNGKMLIALLIEKYLGDIDFSPSWNIRKESEYMERYETYITFDICEHTSR